MGRYIDKQHSVGPLLLAECRIPDAGIGRLSAANRATTGHLPCQGRGRSMRHRCAAESAALLCSPLASTAYRIATGMLCC
jgi:hypothetical protein